MGALSLAVVQKEVEARNTSFLEQLATFSNPNFRAEHSPYYIPPPAHLGQRHRASGAWAS